MAAQARVSKHINDEEFVNRIAHITEDEMTLSFFMEVFGEFGDKRRCNPYDTITIPANSYGPEGNKNTEPFTDTVGVYLFNKYFIEKDLFDVFQYVDETIDGDKFEDLSKEITQRYLEDKLDLEVYKRFQKKTQKTMPYVSILSPSLTENMLTSSSKLKAKKKELVKKYEKRLKAGDELAADEMQKELMVEAKKILKDDPAMDVYNSGARGSFGNNYKNMFIMKGAIKDPDPNKGYDIAVSNYIDGISKDEYAVFANSMIAGPYARGKKTEKGGYWEKLFLSAFQHIKLDKPGSDCGTKRYITVELTKKNINGWMYSYIIEGSNLVELTSDVKDKYIGKTVKVRFSSLCESKTGYCNKCVGNLFYRMGVLNIGTATPQIPAKLKLLSMKAFHNSQVEFTEIDVMNAFSLNS